MITLFHLQTKKHPMGVINSGESGIRTHDKFPYNSFRNYPIQPLWHLSNVISFLFGGVCWTKFETISSKIQTIKTNKMDSAGRNNLSGVLDSPCLGSFPARRRGLGRNAGGFRKKIGD